MIAVYDLAKSPPTHDFVNWLARAEAQRIAAGDETLTIVIKPGERRISPRDLAYSREKRAWRIRHLLAPLAWLVPSVVDVRVDGEGEQTLPYANPGKPVAPMLKAPQHALDTVRAWLPENAVTITLRESDFEPVRNTVREEWLRVARWLHEQGYAPIFVPDAERDMRQPGGMYPYFNYHAAAHCLDLKLALYESACMNLMTNSGVMLMALYADVPLLCFKLEVDEVPCCRRLHLLSSGFAPTFDWSTPKNAKRLFWEPDTYDFITRACRLYLPRIEEAA